MAEPKQQPPYPLRMPDEMRSHLEDEAAQYKRSLHAHILAMLQEHPRLIEKLSDTYTELQSTKDQLNRIPADLKAKLEAAAVTSGRDYDGEVSWRLSNSFESEAHARSRERLFRGNMALLQAMASYLLIRIRPEEPYRRVDEAMLQVAESVKGASADDDLTERAKEPFFNYVRSLAEAVEHVTSVLGPGWGGRLKKPQRLGLPPMSVMTLDDGSLAVYGDQRLVSDFLAENGIRGISRTAHGAVVNPSEAALARDILGLTDVVEDTSESSNDARAAADSKSEDGEALQAQSLVRASNMAEPQGLGHETEARFSGPVTPLRPHTVELELTDEQAGLLEKIARERGVDPSVVLRQTIMETAEKVIRGGAAPGPAKSRKPASKGKGRL